MRVQTTIAMALLAGCNLAYAAPAMQPGLWEIRTRMDVPGMPAGMGQHTAQVCYRPSDVEDASKTVPKNKDCDLKDYKLVGNTASWRMECRGENQMTATGTFTYAGTSYTGTSKMTMKRDGQTMNITQSYAAKRIGDCK